MLFSSRRRCYLHLFLSLSFIMQSNPLSDSTIHIAYHPSMPLLSNSHCVHHNFPVGCIYTPELDRNIHCRNFVPIHRILHIASLAIPLGCNVHSLGTTNSFPSRPIDPWYCSRDTVVPNYLSLDSSQDSHHPVLHRHDTRHRSCNYFPIDWHDS